MRGPRVRRARRVSVVRPLRLRGGLRGAAGHRSGRDRPRAAGQPVLQLHAQPGACIPLPPQPGTGGAGAFSSPLLRHVTLSEAHPQLTHDAEHTALFPFPQSSIPPTALSATARWNLCPTAPLAHGSDCYFPADRPFPGVAGNATVVLADLPAGAWQVVVKGDPLWKASAGVFDYANLTRAAAGAKARIRFAVRCFSLFPFLRIRARAQHNPSTRVVRPQVSLASDAASASWNATIAALNQTLVVSRLTVRGGSLSPLHVCDVHCAASPFLFDPRFSRKRNCQQALIPFARSRLTLAII